MSFYYLSVNVIVIRNITTCAGEKLSHRFHRFTQIAMRRRILLQISQMGTD